MKAKKNNNKYIIRLEKGEEVMKTLKSFCEDNNILAGSLTGIGATNDVSIKGFDTKKNEYVSKRMNEESYEIISLNGNISRLDDKPFLHVHIALSDSSYNTFGGHLESAVISVTCEIIIDVIDEPITRKLDDEFKLNLLNF